MFIVGLLIIITIIPIIAIIIIKVIITIKDISIITTLLIIMFIFYGSIVLFKNISYTKMEIHQRRAKVGRKNNLKSSGGQGCLVRIIAAIAIVVAVSGYGYSRGIDGFKIVYEVGKSAVTGKPINLSRGDLTADSNGGSNTESTTTTTATSSTAGYTPLSFTGKRQMVNTELDNLGRATSGHIQLKASQMPSGDRESKITVDPTGWHNYRFTYVDDSNNERKAYLFNRGHLVGYQFSGLNSEVKNLVIMTRYLNAGTISDRAMDDDNPDGMLFYENALAKWLKNNTDSYLDYYVVANYTGDELVPRTVTLYWTGFSSSGKQIKVELDEDGNESYDGLVGSVTLDNKSSNADIDYLNGTATSLYK